MRSNGVKPGSYGVAGLTNDPPPSLNDDIVMGKPWDLERMQGGVHRLQPDQEHCDSDWYQGTADAVYQNLDSVESSKSDYVLILAGDHVSTMDYRTMIQSHVHTHATVTLWAYRGPVPDAPVPVRGAEGACARD